MLAIAALNTWLKFLLKLRVTKMFGPMFKTLLMMTLDLSKFMILWFCVILMFSCVALLIFSELDSFNDLLSIFVIYFEAALGNWNLKIYKLPPGGGLYSDGPYDETLYNIGIFYHVLILLINLVLFLNFVIAILSATFANYQDKQLGLFYEVIVGLFPSMEYDSLYGAMICASSPFNIITTPFLPIYALPLSTNALLKLNKFLCNLLFAPIAICILMCHTTINAILVPVAYVQHTLALISTLTNADETMDEFSEKLRRFFTIVQFILGGWIFLILSVPFNSVIFFYNLYTRSIEDMQQDMNHGFRKESLSEFLLVCDETLNAERKKPGQKRTNCVNFIKLNKNLQKRLGIQDQIHKLIYNNTDDAKFYTDPITKTKKLNPKFLAGIKEYNGMKLLVVNCADKTGMVNI